ncbi:MAG: hypothetical protein HRU11_13630 [Parvularculaceae bacterium]|nr:hypothetical protein [Parvularculaceae bacterium]
MIWQILGTLVGLALIVISLPLTVSPIPFGLILMFTGIVILVASNPLAAAALRALRRRYAWVDGLFDRAQTVLPDELAEPLRQTDIEQPEPVARAAPEMRRVGYPRYLR